jgi:hypothetical protein
MNSARRNIAHAILVAGGLSLLVVTSIAVAAPTVVVCQPTKVKAAASGLGVCVSSTSFATIPETSINFVQGGAGASCVIVLFTAEAATLTASGGMWVRALLDGTTTGLPAGVQFKNGDVIASQAASFIFPSVAPGSHNIKMQWERKPGSDACVGPHNTIVHYAP